MGDKKNNKKENKEKNGRKIKMKINYKKRKRSKNFFDFIAKKKKDRHSDTKLSPPPFLIPQKSLNKKKEKEKRGRLKRMTEKKEKEKIISRK